MPRRVLLLLTCTILLTACGERIAPPGEVVVPLFEDVTIHFTPDDTTRYDTPFAGARDNGRVMTTYRELPGAIGPRRLTLRLALRPIPKDIRNMHDRWDRAGWVRLVPEEGPPVELARFITSYGGATEHELDVTHLAPLLRGHCRFEVFIDTWVTPAWHVDVDLVTAPLPPGSPPPPAWARGAVFPDGGLNAEAPAASGQVIVPVGTRRVMVAAISTGHCTDGRDADEFITKDNVLLVDGVVAHRWRPWRDDCGELRHLNPYCAKWSDGSWSSDYSRSGWCPGDVAPPDMVDLTRWLTPGTHTLTWQVEDIRPADPADPDKHHGYWRVSASVMGW